MVQQVLTKTWDEVDTITDNSDAVIDAAGNVVAANLTATGLAINFVTSDAVLTVGVGADNGTVSAGIFTDRTKHFEGDALEAIAAIAGVNGEIDHETLPEFTRAKVMKPIFEERSQEVPTPKGEKPPKKKVFKKVLVQVAEEPAIERDIGATVSVLVVAIQQLTAKIKELENK